MRAVQAPTCRVRSAAQASKRLFMIHVLAVAATAVWVAANFFLWSLKQPQAMLLLQATALGVVGFAALWWYVRR
jgi:hypothetical protein